MFEMIVLDPTEEYFRCFRTVSRYEDPESGVERPHTQDFFSFFLDKYNRHFKWGYFAVNAMNFFLRFDGNAF